MRQILDHYRAPQGHWVGDGFPVRSLFAQPDGGDALSPFLLFDYAGPAQFAPAERPRGVGTHPHRGFETVTIVYQGEVAHRDSTGEGGVIGPGDVQWMTAASGILHQEFHSPAFTARGGTLEMAQLWVNLPARDKSAAPGYQSLLDRDIPVIGLANGAGRARVIAGTFGDARGPARTHTPIELWDVRLDAGASAALPVPDGHNAMVVVLKGAARVNDSAAVGAAETVVLSRDGAITVTAERDTTLLLLAGAPIDEPVAMRGPFVMNTEAELHAAMADFRSGKFGAIPA